MNEQGFRIGDDCKHGRRPELCPDCRSVNKGIATKVYSINNEKLEKAIEAIEEEVKSLRELLKEL